MITTEEDDAGEDYSEGEHVRRPGATHLQDQPQCQALLDHGSHTSLQPSPCAVAHTALTSSFPPADESPPLPSLWHDATQSPAVVRHSATPPHAHNAVWCRSDDEAVAATGSVCTERNIITRSLGCHVASSDQTTLHPGAEFLIRCSNHDRDRNLDSSTSSCLNFKRSLIGSNCLLNSDLTSALVCQVNSADDPIKATQCALPSSPPRPGHLERSPRSFSHAAEASLPHSEPLVSGCSTTTFLHHHRSPSQCPSSATPRSVSPSVAGKPPQRQDHAIGISTLDSTDKHARVDSSVGRTEPDTSSYGREISINNNNNIDSICQLSSYTSPDNITVIPPLEQPLPPPSPPPPPDDTVPLLSPDLTASWSCYSLHNTLCASSQQSGNDFLGDSDEELFANNAEESEVANRCANLRQSKRYSDNPGPVFDSMSFDSDEPLKRTLSKSLIGSDTFHEMHHNGDVCFGGQERPSAMDLVGDFKTEFSDAFSYRSKQSPLVPLCSSLTATVVACKQDHSGNEPSEQPYKVCNRVSETECYASSGIAALNCSVRHGETLSDLLCEPNSRNTSGSYPSSVVDDFKAVSGSELLCSKNSREIPPLEPWSSPVEDFGDPVLFLKISRDPDTILSSNSSCSDALCCSSKELLTRQPNGLINCTDNGVDGLSESFQPVTLQTRCSNSSSTIAPVVNSFSSCIPHQHTSPSPSPPLVDGSSAQLDAESPVDSVQTALNSLHRHARPTTRETPHLTTTTLDVNCTCSSNCCENNEVVKQVSPSFDINNDIPRGGVIVSNIRHSDSTVLSSLPSPNPDNTSVFKRKASTVNGLPPHPQESVRTTEGPPISTTVGEDHQFILPPEAGVDRESSECKMDSDSLLTATGLVLMRSQSSGIASVPLEECYPPPLSAALPSKTRTIMALDSCSEDLIGSLECDVVPSNAATPSPCANTLENTISPSDDGAFVHEPPNSVHDDLLQPRHVTLNRWDIDHQSASPSGTMFWSPGDTECRLGEGPSSVSSSQLCSVFRPNSEFSDVSIARQPASISPALYPSNVCGKEQPQRTQEPDQVVTVPTVAHQRHSLSRSTEVAPDKTCEAFDSVITAHRSALKVLVTERIPSVGDVSIFGLSDTSQILFDQDKSKANSSAIFSEDRTFYPSEGSAFSTSIQTGASEQPNVVLHCRAFSCTGASLVSVDTFDGVTSNRDTGCSNISPDNIDETSRTTTREAATSKRDQAQSLSVAPKAVSETTLYVKSNEPSLTSTICVGEPANNRYKDSVFLTKLDQFASHLAKELVQESVLLSSTHAWNIRCSGQCRREQCRQDYYQSLLLLNASLVDHSVAAEHDYVSSSSAGVKKGIYVSSGTKAASIYSSSSSSTYGRNSSSSVGSGGWLNSLTHHGGVDRRDSMNGVSGAAGCSGRASAMVLALSSGGSPGLCWTPELPYASESGGKTVDDEEEFLSPRDSDNGSGGASSGSKKLFGGSEGSVVVETMLGKRSPYKFQKTISTNTTSTYLNVPFGRVDEISTVPEISPEPERRIESGGLAENISKELHHVISTRFPTDVISSTLCCPSPSLPTSLPPSLPASLPPSRSSLSPPPSLSSTRPSGHHSRSSLSVSHDSLVCKTSTAYEASLDDSHLITAAFSHDALHYGGHEEVAVTASMLTRNETFKTKQAQDTNNSVSQHLSTATGDLPSSRLPSNGIVKESEGVKSSVKDCDSNSDMFCPRTDPTSCPVGKESSSGGQKQKRRTKSRKRSSSNRQQQGFSKSSSHVPNQSSTSTTINEGKFYRKSRKHKTIDPSEVYSVPIDSIEDPGIAHPKAVIATQPRRHSHRKHRVTSSTITAGLPLINSSNIITNSNSDVVSNSFGVGANGVSDACLSHSADLRVVIGGKASSKESKKKRFSSNKQSRAAVTSSVELSSPSSRQSIVSNFGCGNNNKSFVFSSPKQKPKHPDGKQSVASDPIHMAADDLQKTGHVSPDHEVHSDTVHRTYSNSSRVSRKERHEHHSRICRILPFTALKSCKRKDHSSESRDDVYVAASAQNRAAGKNSTGDQRKRGNSLFSNIRNSLLSLFSFGVSGGSDRSLSKEHKLRLESTSGGVEGLRSSTSLDSDSQAVISTSGSEVSVAGCEGPTPSRPSAAIKSNDVTALDLLNHSNYSAFTSAINVTSARSVVIGAAGADASEGGRDRGYNGGGIDGFVLSPEEQNCHGDDSFDKETLQRSNNAESVRAALLVPPPLPPANDPTTNSNNPLHTAPSVSASSVVTTSSAPLIASSASGCRSPVPVITNRALPPLPSAQPASSVSNKATNINSSVCNASPTPPPIPPPLPQSLLSAVGPPLPPPLPATLRHSVAASIAAKASAAGAGESRKAMGRGSSAATGEVPVKQAEKAAIFLVHGTASSVQESVAAGERKEEEGCHFATMIEKVKDYGWYWGPISGKAAEKIISNEPDGSFIVRDSSDDHYIFSLTFKLNGFTRHVRIEHDQGNFSFGGYTKFKSQTIVEFIESAVEHSRSGRYLFFLHRRPVLGPMRVQLLHPVSRHRHIQSLQHLCRFVIVKNVRRDLLQQLPLPVRLRDYLTSPHYYSEQVDQCMAEEEEEQERALQEAALATGATGREDNIQEQEMRAAEEAVLEVNSFQGQNIVPPLINPQEIESNRVTVEPVNDLVSNREGHESVSFKNPVQSFKEPCTAAPGELLLPSGVTSREGSYSDRKPGSFLEAGSYLEDNPLLFEASGVNKDLNFRPVLHQEIQEGVGSKSLKRRSWDGTEAAAGGNSMSSCSDSVRSGRSAVESPTLEFHAVLEALNCLDESITQAEASIVAQAECPSDEHSCVQSYHPSNSCILSENKCISAVSNPACDSQIISRVDKDSCSNPLTGVHSNKSTSDGGATTRSLCSNSTMFPSSSAAPVSGVSSKPLLSLSSYLHASPGKQIHKYKPGKIVSYQVDLASSSPTVIKLTKLVNQRISDEFHELNGSTTKNNIVPAGKCGIDEDGNTISTRDCELNTHCGQEQHPLDLLHSNSDSELKENVSKHDLDHLLDCCSVGGAVIGLVDLETAFRCNKLDTITSNCSSENNKNIVSKSLIGHLSVLEDSSGHRDGSGVEKEHSGAMVKSFGRDFNDHIHEEAEMTNHTDRNENNVDGGQADGSSSRGVVVSSPHARHPTLQQSFVNSASPLPSVILNASLEELGSF